MIQETEMRNSKYFRLLTVLFKSIQIYFKNAQKAEHTFNIKCFTKFSTFQNFYHCQNFEIQISTFIKVAGTVQSEVVSNVLST